MALIKSLLKEPLFGPAFLANYRPMSKHPILERVVDWLMIWRGFGTPHSTETVLVKFTTDLLVSSDSGLIYELVLLDLLLTVIFYYNG